MTSIFSAFFRPDIIDGFSSDRMFGVYAQILSVLGVVCTAFLTYETIPYLLRKGNESEAIINLLKLRNEWAMTPKLTNDFDEMKLMVGQDKRESQNILSDGNASVTGKMIILRVLATMTNNMLINYFLIITVAWMLNYTTNYHIAPVILTASRFVGSFFPVFTMDSIKRKIHLTGSSVVAGTLMFIVAIIMVTVTSTTRTISLTLGVLAILFQIIVSLGIDPVQHLLLSEAFSTSKKSWSIALVTSVEDCLQILFIGVQFLPSYPTGGWNVILFLAASIILCSGVLLQFAIPETLKKSLKETRDLFR